MHAFIATATSQGDRPDDYSWTVEGELVRFGFDVCNCPDCGCDRGMAGLSSSRATTTFMVKDIPDLALDQYTQSMRDALLREGWLTEGDDDSWVVELARLQADLAASFVPGTILGVKSRAVTVRR
jgi:hypothetical protein